MANATRTVAFISFAGALAIACGSDRTGDGEALGARALHQRPSPAALPGETPPGGASDAGLPTPRPEWLDALVLPLIDGEWVVGVSIALVTADTIETHGYGTLRYGGPAVDGRTMFEIASVTKTFTSLLLADLVREGRVGLDDPVAALLPPDVRVPELDGRAITLLDLATHTSGLPRLPTNIQPEDPADPYADYQVGDLYEFLSSYVLPVAPGTRFEYSNAGVGLLGHALSLAAGTSYDEAIRERIAVPLGLMDTSVDASEAQAARVATSHDINVEPIPSWRDTPATVASGGLGSTAEDLGRYVAAELAAASLAGTPSDAGLAASPVLESMALTQIPRRETDSGVPIGLAWFFLGPSAIWHNGATYGQSSFVLLDLARGVGVAVLANTASEHTDTLALELYTKLAGGTPQPLDLPPSVRLDASALDRAVGSYRFGDGTEEDASALLITREGVRLYCQFRGDEPRSRLFASSATTFAWRAIGASVRFEPEDASRFERLIVELDGASYPATRE